jgi:hypothetical protein
VKLKKNKSLNLFNNNNQDQKSKNKIINSKNNNNKTKKIIKNNSNKINNNKNNSNKIIGRKSTNNKPSQLLNKVEKNNNNKYIDKNKSTNNFKINKKTTDIKKIKNNNKKEKEKISEFILKDKSDKENINLLNSSPKTSRIKETNKPELNKKTKSYAQFEFDDNINKKTDLIPKKNFDKIIIKFEDLIEFDTKLNSIISSLSSIFNTEISNEETTNECSEFFSFYFHSSLNNIFSNFFSKKNKLIINSSNNLLFFSIVVLYHLSLNKKMLNDLLDDMKYIFSLLKINFFLLVKKIEYYYQDDYPIYCTDLFNQKFVQYNSINCSNEIDLISKINKNCLNITERMKLVLNYYDRNNDTHYDEFSGLFKNISSLTENDILLLKSILDWIFPFIIFDLKSLSD